MKNSDRPIYPIVNEAGFATRVRNLEPEQAIGLTKLEYFAGLAMQAIIAQMPNDEKMYKLQLEYYRRTYGKEVTLFVAVAKEAVNQAQSLLTELENQ